MQEESSKTMVHPLVLLLFAVWMNQVGSIDRFGVASLIRMFSNVFVLLGFASYGVSSVAYLIALSKLDLSVAYPMVGIGYVLVMLISGLFLKETVGPLRWLGALLIFAGVWLVGRR